MKVISFYSDDLNIRGQSHLSATNKLNYIIDIMRGLKENVSLLSLSAISNNGKTIKPETKVIDSNFSISYQKCFPKRNFFEKVLHKLIDSHRTYKFLLKNIEEGELVYLYHPSLYHKLLEKVIRRKKARLILEVEEIYGDVSSDAKLKMKELKFFKSAEAFIFPTVLLNNLVNADNKPFVIVHGSYILPPVASSLGFKDNKIHIVYSGTFNNIKGGWGAAIESILYLDEHYHIHILGFGTKNEVSDVISRINEIKEKTKCEISYEGMLVGEEYISFLRKCDIGLSTQNPELEFNNSSFPSKVITYMTCNLRVVSTKNISTIKSDVSDYVYYTDYDAKSIANTIKGINLREKYDGREIIDALNKKFCKDFYNLIQKINKQ